jgi:hypothetical protein
MRDNLRDHCVICGIIGGSGNASSESEVTKKSDEKQVTVSYLRLLRLIRLKYCLILTKHVQTQLHH